MDKLKASPRSHLLHWDAYVVACCEAGQHPTEAGYWQWRICAARLTGERDGELLRYMLSQNFVELGISAQAVAEAFTKFVTSIERLRDLVQEKQHGP